MSKVAIIYWSSTGNTQAMAEAIFEGAKEVNSDVALFQVSETSASDALAYDTLILGCPAMGAENLEEGEFEPFFSEIESSLAGKNIALFGSYGWGDGTWMRDWEDRVNTAGGSLVEDGLTVNETPDGNALVECQELGKRVAKL